MFTNSNCERIETFYCSSCGEQIGASIFLKEVTMHQDKITDRITFKRMPDKFYSFISFEWGKPQYKTVRNTNSYGRRNSKWTFLSLCGSCISLLFGFSSSTSRSNSVSRKVEVSSPAYLSFRNLRTGEKHVVVINCDSKIKGEMMNFKIGELPMIEDLRINKCVMRRGRKNQRFVWYSE